MWEDTKVPGPSTLLKSPSTLAANAPALGVEWCHCGGGGCGPETEAWKRSRTAQWPSAFAGVLPCLWLQVLLCDITEHRHTLNLMIERPVRNVRSAFKLDLISEGRAKVLG